MTEVELKFQVPDDKRVGVQRAVATSTAREVRMRAQYFDTADRRLAAAGLALRLRQEGRRWVQTVKGHGEGHLCRQEHEVAIGGASGAARIDLARHAGTPLGAALDAALGDQAVALQLIFETDVRRTLRLVRNAGAQVEMSLDVGRLCAGTLRQPVFELEFELKGGPVAGLLALAGSWVERHAIWLDVRSKAERGDRLARGIDAGAAVHAHCPTLVADMQADAALRAMVSACLAQVLPNAAELAAGTGSAEHLHQLRVGLRRLRTVLRAFGDWSGDVDALWAAALSTLFGQLGSARNLDAMAESLLPRLRAAGAPFTELPAEDGGSCAGDVLRAASCGRLWIDLIGFAHGAAAPAAADATTGAAPTDLRTLVRPLLRRLHRQVIKDAKRWRALDDDERHRLRRRLKRLRYVTEFVAALCPARRLQRSLRSLSPAQEALGEFNDLIVAEAAFRAQLEHDARAWFAIGWLAAQRAPLLDRAARSLKKLAKAPRPC